MTETIITRQNGSGQPVAETITYDPARRYVAGGTRSWRNLYTHALPQSIDDLSAELGADIYERMEKDPQVSACLVALKTGIIAHGYRIEPCELSEDASDEDRAKAAEYAALCKAQLEQLETSFVDALDNLLDALAFGNKIAELVWDTSNPTEWRLVAVSPKHRSRLAYVIDAFGKVLGFLVTQPGQPFPSISSLETLPSNFVPREKFAVFSYSPRDDDPRGRSVLRAAYQPWWIKMQIYPEWLKYLSQFAVPSVVGYTAPESGYRAGITTNTTTPEEDMVNTLMAWANGSVAAFPNGASVEPIEVSGDGGKVFDLAFNRCDNQIVLAVLAQLLATGTAEYQTNASTKTHQDVFDDVIAKIKAALEAVVRNDILKKIVLYNFGEQSLRLTPQFSLGQVEQQDFAQLAGAIAQLQTSGYLVDEQKPEIDVMLNLPRRPDNVPDDAPEAEVGGAAPNGTEMP